MSTRCSGNHAWASAHASQHLWGAAASPCHLLETWGQPPLLPCSIPHVPRGGPGAVRASPRQTPATQPAETTSLRAVCSASTENSCTSYQSGVSPSCSPPRVLGPGIPEQECWDHSHAAGVRYLTLSSPSPSRSSQPQAPSRACCAWSIVCPGQPFLLGWGQCESETSRCGQDFVVTSGAPGSAGDRRPAVAAASLCAGTPLLPARAWFQAILQPTHPGPGIPAAAGARKGGSRGEGPRARAGAPQLEGRIQAPLCASAICAEEGGCGAFALTSALAWTLPLPLKPRPDSLICPSLQPGSLVLLAASGSAPCTEGGP